MFGGGGWFVSTVENDPLSIMNRLDAVPLLTPVLDRGSFYSALDLHV